MITPATRISPGSVAFADALSNDHISPSDAAVRGRSPRGQCARRQRARTCRYGTGTVHVSELSHGEGNRYVARTFPKGRPDSKRPERHPGSAHQRYQYISDQRHPRQQHRRGTIPSEQRTGSLHPPRCWRRNSDDASTQPICRARSQEVPRCGDDNGHEPAARTPDDDCERHLGCERQNGRSCKAPGKENEKAQTILAVAVICLDARIRSTFLIAGRPPRWSARRFNAGAIQMPRRGDPVWEEGTQPSSQPRLFQGVLSSGQRYDMTRTAFRADSA